MRHILFLALAIQSLIYAEEEFTVLNQFKAVELTHIITPDIATWDGSCGFKHIIALDYADCTGTPFQVQLIEMRAGIGTHMDAPAHSVQGSAAISDIPLSQLIVPVVVIDVSATAHPDYMVSKNDVLDFEATYGAIPPNSLVLANTG